MDDAASQDRVRRKVRVSGRVQGVFFRDSCRQQAQRLGVTGWVRNADDGSVEGEFEGGRAVVEELIAWCQRGPAGARVDTVDDHGIEPSGDSGFRVVG